MYTIFIKAELRQDMFANYYTNLNQNQKKIKTFLNKEINTTKDMLIMMNMITELITHIGMMILTMMNKVKSFGINFKKNHLPTHVLRDCELCGKFTFFFRKKFSSNRKYSVTKLATSQSAGTLAVRLQRPNVKRKLTNKNDKI